jgi:(1->4)-alpha-D-glucan 1-alpha-D-glucosylmutase
MRRARLFESGGYRPIAASGEQAGNLVAFARGEGVVAVVPRLTVGLEADGGWGDTAVELPACRWSNVLTGEAGDGGARPVGELLARFPLALLERLEA